MKSLFLIFVSNILCVLAFANTGESDLEKEKRLSKVYLEQMSQEKNAQVLDQGVVLRPIFTSSSAVFPKISDTISVTYHLTDREGKLIEESISGDEVPAFPLEKLISCWKIAVPAMPIGSLLKVTCPSNAAYGDKGAGNDIKGGAAITFRLIVLGIENK